MSPAAYEQRCHALVESFAALVESTFSRFFEIPVERETLIDGMLFRFCRGSIVNLLDDYLYARLPLIDEIIDRGDFDVIAFGPTHKPFIIERGGRWLLNPGSVTLPRGSFKNPSLIVGSTSPLRFELVQLEQRISYERRELTRVALVE